MQQSLTDSQAGFVLKFRLMNGMLEYAGGLPSDGMQESCMLLVLCCAQGLEQPPPRGCSARTCCLKAASGLGFVMMLPYQTG
jgi:hypothetical protein